MIDLDITYRCARREARRVLPRDCGWHDDVVQEVVLEVLALRERGIRASRLVYRRAAINAMRRILGDSRNRETWDRHLEHGRELETVCTREIDGGTRAIALWRLQRVWPTLTDRQQRGLLCRLVGGSMSDEAAEIGTTKAAMCNAASKAADRIDRMHDYTRIACERDPAENARARQRRYQERLRAELVKAHALIDGAFV